MVILATSALLYWNLDPGQISPAAGQAIDDADRLIVSSISVWDYEETVW
jgi:PIN domain nuclease of toxin-antitoxin system